MLLKFIKRAFKQNKAIDAHHTLKQGVKLYHSGDSESALKIFRYLIEANPSDAHAYNNLGLALGALGKFEESLASHKKAVSLAPVNHDMRYNVGLAYFRLGSREKGEHEIRSVLKLNSEHIEANAILGMLMLLRGEFTYDAWRRYQFHANNEASTASWFSLPYSEWDGDNVDATRILLLAEQGLGDQILFASCIPDFLLQCSGSLLLCDQRLVALFKRSFPSLDVYGYEEPRTFTVPETFSKISYVAPLRRLPLYYRTSLQHFPSQGGFLEPDPDRVFYWENRLKLLGAGRKIGISWRGGTPKTFQARRSTNLLEWEPILRVEGAHFISLQYTNCESELDQLHTETDFEIHHWQAAIDDYDETAALVSALDLVISVTTSLVHLSGAIGQSTWVLVNTNPQWRYLESGTVMPWYPSVELFRQTDSARWDDVFYAVSQRLKLFCSK